MFTIEKSQIATSKMYILFQVIILVYFNGLEMKMYLSKVMARRFTIDNATLVVELILPILQTSTASVSPSTNNEIFCTNQGGKNVTQTMISDIAIIV